MARCELKATDVRDNGFGLFFTDTYVDGKQQRQRIVNVQQFADVVQFAKRTNRLIVVTYPNAEFSCNALTVRIAEIAPDEAVQPAQ